MTAPIAYWQHGRAGIVIVAVAAAAIVLSLWLAAWLGKTLSHAGSATAGLLAATGLRMTLPLALALVLVVEDSELLPARAALYLVPLYLAMLCGDTVGVLRRPRGPEKQAAPWSEPAGSADVGQG